MTADSHLHDRAALEQLEGAQREVGELRGEVDEVCERLLKIARCAWSGPAADAWRARLVELRSDGQDAAEALDRLRDQLGAAAARVGSG